MNKRNIDFSGNPQKTVIEFESNVSNSDIVENSKRVDFDFVRNFDGTLNNCIIENGQHIVSEKVENTGFVFDTFYKQLLKKSASEKNEIDYYNLAIIESYDKVKSLIGINFEFFPCKNCGRLFNLFTGHETQCQCHASEAQYYCGQVQRIENEKLQEAENSDLCMPMWDGPVIDYTPKEENLDLRKNGKSTRLVDNYVQQIFNNPGERIEIHSEYEKSKDNTNKNKCLLSAYIFDVIMSRLNLEHKFSNFKFEDIKIGPNQKKFYITYIKE